MTIAAAKAQLLIIDLRYKIIEDIRLVLKFSFFLIAMAVVNVYALKHYFNDMPVAYVAVENNGQELVLKTLGKSPFPDLTLAQEKLKIQEIVTDCLEQFFHTDSLNFLTDFQVASSCFSNSTYNLFTQSLVDAGYIELLKGGEVWSGNVRNTNVNNERSIQGGRLTWILNVPFQLKRYTTDGPKFLDLDLRVRVSRMNSLEYKHSLAITQVVMKDV